MAKYVKTYDSVTARDALSDVNITKVVETDKSQVLTSKTINAPDNTLTNIANTHIATAAGIQYSKLSLSGEIVNNDISGSAGIQYNKLSLTNSLVNNDISSSAGILYSKLNLSNSIVNTDIVSGTIADSKLAEDYVRTSEVDNTTIVWSGTQLAVKALGITNAYISNSAAIAYSKLDIANGDLSIAKTSGLQTALDAKLPLAGGTMAGNIVMGANKITSSYVASLANDLPNKAYVDNAIGGLHYHAPAEAFNLISDVAQGGSAPSAVAGDTWIADNWGGGYTNGHIYYYTGSVWTDEGALVSGTYYVLSTSVSGSFASHAKEITYWDGAIWTFTVPVDGDAILIHGGYYINQGFVYDGTNWNQFSGAGQLNAGIGLTKDGNTLNVNLGAGILELPSDEIGVDVATNGGLELTSQLTGGQLKVQVDNATLGLSVSGVYVKNSGITATQLATSVAGDGITGGAGTALAAVAQANEGAKVGVAGIAVDYDNATIGIVSNKLAVKATGIALGNMATDSVDENKLLSTTFRAGVTGGSATKVTVNGTYVKLTNNTGSQIAIHSLVATGPVAGEITMADASVSGVSIPIGAADENIANTAQGWVQVSGEMQLINGGTAFVMEKPVYQSGTAGEATKTAPTNPGTAVVRVGMPTATNKVVFGVQHIIDN